MTLRNLITYVPIDKPGKYSMAFSASIVTAMLYICCSTTEFGIEQFSTRCASNKPTKQNIFSE